MLSGPHGLCLVHSPLNTGRGRLALTCSDMGLLHPRASVTNQGTQAPTNPPARSRLSPGNPVQHCRRAGAPADEADCSCERKEGEERGCTQGWWFPCPWLGMTSHIRFPYKSTVTFSCLWFGTAWPTLPFIVIICWGFLCFLCHHHIFARNSRCLTMWLDAAALTEVLRCWAGLRNQCFVLLLYMCYELLAVKIFHV